MTDESQQSQGGTQEQEVQTVVPEKFQPIVQMIETMSVLDLSELVKILEKKFGVSAQAPMMMAAAAPADSSEGESAGEEKTSFNVELTEVGANKIGVIKVVREITEKGLKEAKDLVEGAPKIVKESVAKEEAEAIKKKIEEAGGKATLK